MIPDLSDNGLLPPGVHPAKLEEVKDRFGRRNAERKELFRGLSQALDNLREAGVQRVYLNGSFVTDKPHPVDVDGCWDADANIDLQRLDPVFLSFDHGRRQMKDKYGVDFFPASFVESNSSQPFLDFFQVDKDGRSKGVVVIDL